MILTSFFLNLAASSESLDIAKIETLRRENAVLMQKVVELQQQLDAKQEEKQEMLQKEEEDRQKMILLAKLVQREREQVRCTNCTRPRDTVVRSSVLEVLLSGR
jgi:hypothetical protein